MHPSQLPTANRYFTVENDFRPILSGLSFHLHAIVHFREPSVKFRQKINRLVKSTGLGFGVCYDLLKGDNASYDHVVVAVATNGACYIGRSIVNPKSNDQYNRHFGFRLATYKALLSMELSVPVDFEIGIEPPSGKLLNTVIAAKLEQFNILQLI
jgi:hypothetical protein